MTTTIDQPGRTDRFDDLLGSELKIIDCDAHLTEPADLWTSRAPASMQDRVPVQRTIDGVTALVPRRRAVGQHRRQHDRARAARRCSARTWCSRSRTIDPSAWAVKERLDADGRAWASTPRSSTRTASASPPTTCSRSRTTSSAPLVLQTYNDFLVDIQHESGGRLLPQALLPIWDMDLTVKEMTRLLDQGIARLHALRQARDDRPARAARAVLRPDVGPVQRVRSGAPTSTSAPGARKEDIEALRVHGVDEPTAVRPPRSRPVRSRAPTRHWSGSGRSARLAVVATQMYMSNVRIIINLCMSDLFDRYPKLKIVSAESGIGWVPFILEALEFQLDEMVTDPDEVALPAAAARRSTSATTST